MRQMFLYVLYALGLTVGLVFLYFLTVWVLAEIGIAPPQLILKLAFVFLGIVAAIYVVSGSAGRWMRR